MRVSKLGLLFLGTHCIRDKNLRSMQNAIKPSLLSSCIKDVNGARQWLYFQRLLLQYEFNQKATLLGIPSSFFFFIPRFYCVKCVYAYNSWPKTLLIWKEITYRPAIMISQLKVCFFYVLAKGEMPVYIPIKALAYWLITDSPLRTYTFYVLGERTFPQNSVVDFDNGELSLVARGNPRLCTRKLVI